MLDYIRKIFQPFPWIPVPHDLKDDDDMHELTEAHMAKTNVEGCSSFLKCCY